MYRDIQTWERFIGERVKQSRLGRNMPQLELAERSGVTMATISRLEAGKGSSLETLIKILQVLGEEGWFEQLAPDVGFSPIQTLQRGKQRERASKK